MADLVLKDRAGTQITYNGIEVVSIPNAEGGTSHFLNLETGGIPSGGTAGQVLKKLSETDHDVGWEDEVDIKGQLIYAESVEWLEENGDTSKLYLINDNGEGHIWAQILQPQIAYTNLIPMSTVSGGGSIFNDVGYKIGKRLNSSGNEADNISSIITGFIPSTKDSVLRIKYFANGLYSQFDSPGNHILLYDSSYTLLTTAQQGYGSSLKTNNIGVMDDASGIYTVALSTIYNSDDVAFVRVSTAVTISHSVAATETDAQKVIITIDEEITDVPIYVYGWGDTGILFTPYDNGIPSYWLEELESKADAIQQAMEAAGRNKSAFLWYTDAHWPNNAKVSPSLLKYLIKNTPINKVNFGGDIVGDPYTFNHDNVKYVYEWRSMISGLPNHHSVYGNHDVNHRTTDVGKLAYTLLLAPEESSDMVIGGDSYYYIDNPAEKTRYLYLSYLTNDHDEMMAQGQFIIDAITGVGEGWHIVAISHRWFQYYSASAPTEGFVPSFEQDILNVLDEYNARTTHTGSNYFSAQDFAEAKGKVEFCIGGHIHVDYDFTTTGGIPVIITASDTNQERSAEEEEDAGTLGTTTESAVYGIVADYTNNKITVVGVGRGGSREITY
jgi:hypothetical protein